MRTLSPLLVAAAVGLTSTVVRAQTPPSKDYQIAAAEMALPSPLRDGATVLGFVGDLDGDMTELRSGDNGITCRVRSGGRDEGKNRLGVFCRPDVLQPLRDRMVALRESGIERDEGEEILRSEIANGSLEVPTMAVGFVFRGGEGSYGADLEAAKEQGQTWQMIYVPFVTGEQLGLPSEREGSMPWVMSAGRAFAHIMVLGDPNAEDPNF
jgi:hypothetical protein